MAAISRATRAIVIDQLISGAVIAVLNRSLAREQAARALLAAQQGRSVRLSAGLLAVQFSITADGLLAAASGEPAVAISVDPAALPAFLLDSSKPPRQVKLEGDAALAQLLSQVLPRLRPEPEEELSRVIGDAAAVRLMASLRALLSAVSAAAQAFARNSADYLTAENPMLVEKEAVESFGRDLTRLRDDVERLDKRIALLVRR
jgi:ubiquinone biosynthesis accessory factor UbiJ